MNKKLCLLTLLISINILLTAINIDLLKGVVLNEEGKPEKSVKVSINQNFVYTNENGEFAIISNNQKDKEIIFSKKNYLTEKVKLPITTNTLNITLRKEPTRLNTVSITASKKEQLSNDIPVKVDFIDSSEIQKSNSKDVSEVFRGMTGIAVEENGYSRGTVKLQGLPSQYTLVLIDGERTKGGHNGTDVSQIPVEFIERIEIVKGPSSALYGSDALGGVVNIITKNPDKKPNANISYSTGSNNTNIYSLGAGYGVGKWGLLVNARRYDTDGELLSEAYKADNLFIKTSYKGFNQYSASTNYYQEKRNLFAMEETKKDIKFGMDLNNIESMQLKTNFYYIEYIREMNSGNATKAIEDELKASIQLEKYFLNDHGLIAGAEIVFKEYDSHIIEGKDEIKSLYLQYELPVNDKLLTTFGGRLDLHDDWGLKTIPKFSLLYNYSSNFLIRGSVGKGFKAPTLAQLHSFWYHQPGGGLWIKGNPDLEPESSVGINFNSELTYNNTMNSISFFHNNVKDMIVTELIGTYDEDNHPLYTYFNRDKIQTYGAEYQGKITFLSNFNFNLGYTYLMTEDKQNKKELSNSANHKIVSMVGYSKNDIIPNKLSFSVDLRANWRSDIYLDSSNINESKDRIIFDLNSSMVLYKYLNISLGVRNIFDKEYFEFTRMPGRTVFTTFELKY